MHRLFVLVGLLLVSGLASSQQESAPDVGSLQESLCWSCHQPGAYDPAWTQGIEASLVSLSPSAGGYDLTIDVRNPWVHEIPFLLTSLIATPVGYAEPAKSDLFGPWQETVLPSIEPTEVAFPLQVGMDDVNVVAEATHLQGQVAIQMHVESVDGRAGHTFKYTAQGHADQQVLQLTAEQLALADEWHVVVTVPPVPEALGQVQVTVRGAQTAAERAQVHGPLGPGETVRLTAHVPADGWAALDVYQHAVYLHDDRSGTTPDEELVRDSFEFHWQGGVASEAKPVPPAEAAPGVGLLLVLGAVVALASLRRK